MSKVGSLPGPQLPRVAHELVAGQRPEMNPMDAYHSASLAGATDNAARRRSKVAGVLSSAMRQPPPTPTAADRPAVPVVPVRPPGLWQDGAMARGTATHDERLRDLEAEAFRTGRTLAEHSEQLRTIEEQQTTAFGNIDSLANAIGAPGDRTIAQRLDTIERVLFAMARAQGIDPDALT